MNSKTFAMVAGAAIGGTGLLGMIKAFRKPTFEHYDEIRFKSGYGKIAGAIPTNDLFNWVRVGIGVAGIAAARDEETARIYNRALAISYAGMAFMGVLPKADTVFGLMPIFGGNVAVHASTAAAELLTEEKLVRKAKKLLPTARSRRGGKRTEVGRGANA